MKGILYQRGCEARDDYQDFERAVRYFEEANSFESLFALAELYQYGANSPFTSRSIAKDLEKSAEYFLKAYKINEANFVIRVNRYSFDHFSILPISLEKSDELLAQANQLNPEALYRLALFYKKEMSCAVEERVIEANSEQLAQCIKACLQVSANQYHPHAAYLLVQDYSQMFSPEEKLKYCRIAADPDLAMKPLFSSFASQILYRGNRPINTTIELQKPDEFPLELRRNKSISSGTIKGLTAQATNHYTSSVLPTNHRPYNKAQALGGSAPVLTQEALRALRLLRFNAPKVSEASSEKIDSTPTSQFNR
ncbi:hypothetical protein ACNVED_13020 [Legionella sp. D16C41]|uniref:hypothetical protein n=1 Tax=Legionella sp. D16C41 TaxID=3402688 RepID=UPI003AF93013